MTLNLMMPEQDELKPRITVFGVGGAGGNAVNNMIAKQLDGVEFVVANTDAQALQQSTAPAKVQIGTKVTEGLGAGARPSVGAAAAEESIEQIVDHLAGAHMCFITAGMGGGTGTGAAPIIAQAARELGVLTVGVVTKPFQFEGTKRMRQAEEGVECLQRMVDTLIIIPNQNLFRLANEKTTFTEAFSMADDVLYQGVKGVTDLMVRPGLINLDFADVRAVMDEMGKAMMGTGEGEGEDRAIQAAEKAIANPLLDEISLRGAKGVLINVTGGTDLTLFELDESANRIREEVDQDANIIVGSTLDDTMEGRMRVSVVATGIDATASQGDVPLPRRRLSEPLQQPAHVEAAIEEAPTEVAEDQPTQAPAARGREFDRDFFDDVASAPVAEPHGADNFRNTGGRPEASDDLPPPAYQPRHEQQPAAAQSEEAAQPRAQAPGQPSPEALARLQQAVRKTPAGEERAPQEQQPAARQPQGGNVEQHPAAERPRFGINSLINRMTGHEAETQQGRGQPQGQQPAQRRQQPPLRGGQQPAQQPEAQDENSAEQERIEIPAFLRRQAN
ncbi:cell division protein FtsZ [Tranquillimonas rosea]|uniref:cell division protein FtsZ n=1 Tax=Tranquillimonas rosea TaxID=641238 RepID=UPI003BA9C50B